MGEVQNFYQCAPDSRVAIVGGGPAGSFFAALLLKYTSAAVGPAEIAIFDNKQFMIEDRTGCNMCAGAIGSRLFHVLKQEGYRFPDQVLRRQIRGYAIHVGTHTAVLPHPTGSRIYTVYRGSPTPELHGERISFDQYLLDTAVARGAHFYNTRVLDIQMPEAEGEKIVLKLEDKTHQRYEADVVVGAFGVNTTFTRRICGQYRPPRTWRAFQGEIALPPEFIARRYTDMIHLFPLGTRNIKFIALTPKRYNVTVSAIGRDVTVEEVREMLSRPEFRAFLSSSWEFHCWCYPLFPVSSAHHPYANRLVMIGDACVSRYLKSGIESAFYTARFAAETIARFGFSSSQLKRHYYRKCRKVYSWDNQIGKLLFTLNDWIAWCTPLARSHILITQREQAHQNPTRRRLSRILWDLFTGERPYVQILLQILDPRFQLYVIRETLRLLFSRRDHTAVRSSKNKP